MLRVAALYYREPKDHFDPNIVNDPNDPYNYQVYMKRGDTFNPDRTPGELFNYVKIHYSGVQDREKIEQDFTSGRLGVLLSTSTLELGVDYPNVSIVATVGVPFMLESIPQRIGRAGRNPIRTLNTTLAIIILRNTPMELYYMYKPEDLVEGFRKKDIPVAWKNIAVKKYHSLFTVFDEMGRNGEYTYILRTDGRLHDLVDFIDNIIDYIDRVKNKLEELDPRTERDSDPPTKIIEEVKKELHGILGKKFSKYDYITRENNIGRIHLSNLLNFRSLIKTIRKTRYRLDKGVKEELISLVRIKNIGRIRARTLYRNGIKDIGDLKKANLIKLKQLLGPKTAKNVKKQLGQEVEEVKKGKRKGQLGLGKY